MRDMRSRRQGAIERLFDARAALAWLAVALIACIAAAPADANLGYELDSTHPSKALPGAPKGLAVDQENGDIYVAIVSTNPISGALGQVNRFNSDLSADGTFAVSGGYYTGVALNPAGGFFAAQMEIKDTPLGDVGTPKVDKFTSAGASAGSFAISYSNSLPPIVSNAAGRVFVPNVNTHSVQVYGSSGTLVEEVTCSGCPGGTFGKPGSVALDPAGNLYVADVEPDRVVKLSPSGGAYVYSSLIQSGRGAGAVAIDPGNGDILVGDTPGGNDFHIVAYDSSGTQFDDFAAGLFRDVSPGGYGALSSYQLAVNGTTHELYAGEMDKFYAFEMTTISSPSAAVEPATNIGQLQGTLNAKVNANGHAVLECEFEYTTESDFLVNGFSNAPTLACPKKPDGSSATPLSVSVSTLSPNTKYRYRVSATSSGGSTSSGNNAFQTLPELPPTVTMEAPQSVTQTGATLEAKVNPRGGAVVDCHFELGATTSYGTELICPTTPGAVASNVAEAVAISGLAPATTYHYRLVVESNAGTTEGSDIEFTTASPPAEPSNPTPAPPVQATPPPVTPPVTPSLPQCKKGFRRARVGGQARCVKICRRGFRSVRVRGKVKCVPRRSARHRRRAPSRSA